MPQLDMETPSGLVDWRYYISTPTLTSSPAIIPELPCVLFLHGSYSQFADPRLRERLNLIAVDTREYGGTKGPVTKDYTPAVAADDVYRFMQILQLPPVHVFALSIGCCVALELSFAHPDIVRSLTLCSPLSATEPEDVAAGRLEVYGYWKQALVHDGSPLPEEQPKTADPPMLDDCVFGAQQLLFNNSNRRIVHAQYNSSLEWIQAAWAGSPGKLDLARTIGVDWYLYREPYSAESLAKINCPITLIHCDEDIAYPINYIQELQNQLREAGHTDVRLHQVSGPHIGSLVNAEAVNPILRDFILRVENQCSYEKPVPADEFQSSMLTPFTETYARFGFDRLKHSESEESSDYEQ